MSLHETQQQMLLRKIGRRKDEIRAYFVSNRTPISGITYRETREYERYEDAARAVDYKPISVGDTWGAGGTNAWFRITIDIPREFAGREVFAFFRFGKQKDEACLLLDGKPFAGLDNYHDEVLLLEKANGGETFECLVDARCGAPWDPQSSDDEYSNAPAVFERAEIATGNPEVRQYWYSLEVLHLLAEQLPEDSTRRGRIIHLLNKSVDVFDYTHTDDASLAASAKAANEILQPLLDCPSEASALDLSVVGHSHIDSAWRWPFKETVRKCSRTFSTVMRLMERYPEYVYTQGQALLYSFGKEHYPGLWEDIKQRVREGRWDVTGSMWVEADCNLSSGESLIRQVLIGKTFFKDEFGIETDVLWLPDVFGYSAALPQILKKARVNYFFTNKIHWNEINKPPYGTFWWKGIDGTRILSHFPPSSSYNGFPNPDWLLNRYTRNWQDKDRAPDILFTYGWGDGGGGPESRHLEYLRREKDLEGLPRCTHRRVPDFFHRIDNGADYHEWAGELYLEYHRGTYTTQAWIKKRNRRAEFLYRDAEMLSSIAFTMGLPYPREELLSGWKDILANQFHDVIPGTSVRYVYEQCEDAYKRVFAIGEKAIADSLGSIAGPPGDSAVVLFNTLPWDRIDVARIRAPEGTAVLDADGNEVPSQVVDGDLLFAAQVPSVGFAGYRLVPGQAACESNLEASPRHLENDLYAIRFDDRGLMESIVLKSNGRQVLPDGARGNLFQAFEDKPTSWPAWNLDYFHQDKFEDITSLDSIEVVERGPVRAAVQIIRSFGSSKIRQKIAVYSHIPRIDFETWINWHENEKCLKVAFPVEVNSATARYEIQFGNVERPTHSNTSWDFARFEVCAHKWIDYSEQGFGVSLLNDCKYGHSVRGNVMRLTLLRSAKKPDPLADMGEHSFVYSLIPHEGSYIDADTIRHAYQLNSPLLIAPSPTGDGRGEVLPAPSPPIGRQRLAEPREPGGECRGAGGEVSSRSFLSIDAPNVILETMKQAEREDALILRFYECHNRRGPVSVKLRMPFGKVYECDLMEDNLSEAERVEDGFTFEIKPFEIRTFKLLIA